MAPGGFGNSLFVSQIGMNPMQQLAKSTMQPKSKKPPKQQPLKSPRTIKREEDKLEQKMILDIVQRAYRVNVAQKEVFETEHDNFVNASTLNTAQDPSIELFRKMRIHCNFLSDLDSLSDMNKPEKLREVIQN